MNELTQELVVTIVVIPLLLGVFRSKGEMSLSILAIGLANAIAASTKSVVRRLWNNTKDCLWLCDIAAVRRQSGISAVRAFKCIVEFVHHGLAIHAVDRCLANCLRHLRLRRYQRRPPRTQM